MDYMNTYLHKHMPPDIIWASFAKTNAIHPSPAHIHTFHHTRGFAGDGA